MAKDKRPPLAEQANQVRGLVDAIAPPAQSAERVETEIGWILSLIKRNGDCATIKTLSEKLDALPVSRIREHMTELLHRGLVRLPAHFSSGGTVYWLTEKGKEAARESQRA